ncbi:MAG: NfeD family protein [Kiloniellales bacterium]
MILEQAEFWHWWVAGVTLVVAEVFAPGFILFWLGVAAGVVGLVLLLVPAMAWEYQWLIFAVVSVAAIFGWRAFARRHPAVSDHPMLNRRGRQYIGRRFTLEQPIVNGVGMLKVDDTRWKIEGADLPAGTNITVTGVEGTVLKVERA